MSHVNNHPSNASPAAVSCDDRRWLAYRYVSGDLSEAESAAFEEQMAADTARGDIGLCQLVAELVKLHHAVRVVEAQECELSGSVPEPVANTDRSSHSSGIRSTTSQRRALAVIGVVASMSVACVAFVLGTRWNAPVAPPAGPAAPRIATTADPDVSRADRLVSLWRESRDNDARSNADENSDSDPSEHDGDPSWDSVAGAVTGSVRATSPDTDAGSVQWSSWGRHREGDYAVPAWLLAAVSADEMDVEVEKAVEPAPSVLPRSQPRSTAPNPVKEN